MACLNKFPLRSESVYKKPADGDLPVTLWYYI